MSHLKSHHPYPHPSTTDPQFPPTCNLVLYSTFSFDFVWGITYNLLRAYSWLCSQISLLALLKGAYGILDSKPGQLRGNCPFLCIIASAPTITYLGLIIIIWSSCLQQYWIQRFRYIQILCFYATEEENILFCSAIYSSIICKKSKCINDNFIFLFSQSMTHLTHKQLLFFNEKYFI